MCIACVEYNKGNLTLEEYFRNRSEFQEEHDPVAEKAANDEIEFAVMEAIVYVLTTQDPKEHEDYDEWLWEDDDFYRDFDDELDEIVGIMSEEDE